MANGDITKEYENDKREVVGTWNVQVRKATKIMEEQSDGSKKELTRSFHRHVLQPYETSSSVDSDDKITWTHTDTDMSSESSELQGIATAVWTTEIKEAKKIANESTGI